MQDKPKLTSSVNNDEIEEGELPTDNTLSSHQNIIKVMPYFRLIYLDFKNTTHHFVIYIH